MKKKFIALMLAIFMATMTGAAAQYTNYGGINDYGYAGTKTHENFERTYQSDRSSSYDRTVTDSGYRPSNSRSYSTSTRYEDSESFSETIKFDRYERYDAGNRYRFGVNNPYYGGYGRLPSSYSSAYQGYGYSGNYARSRYYNSPNSRYSYNPFGYYEAMPYYGPVVY